MSMRRKRDETSDMEYHFPDTLILLWFILLFFLCICFCLLLYIYILIHSHYGPMLVIKLMLTHIHSFSRFFFYFSFSIHHLVSISNSTLLLLKQLLYVESGWSFGHGFYNMYRKYYTCAGTTKVLYGNEIILCQLGRKSKYNIKRQAEIVNFS